MKWDHVARAGVAVTALVAVAGGLAVTGVLAGAQRNHAGSIYVAVVAVLLASLVWAVWLLLPKTHAHWAVSLLPRILAAVMFAAGVLAIVAGVVQTQRDRQDPAIRVTLDPQTLTLEGDVTVGGLAVHDRLLVQVDGLQLRQTDFKKTSPDYKASVTPLYRASLRPDADGKAGFATQDRRAIRNLRCGGHTSMGQDTHQEPPNATCPMALLPYLEPYAGEEFRDSRVGCVQLRLPSVLARPRVGLTWETHAKNRVLVVRVLAAQAGVRPVAVHVQEVGGSGAPLLDAVIVPGATGAVDPDNPPDPSGDLRADLRRGVVPVGPTGAAAGSVSVREAELQLLSETVLRVRARVP